MAAISNKEIAKNNNSYPDYYNKQHQLVNRLKPETKVALEQAINLVNEKISVIISSFPTAKKKSLFRLRFGVGIDNINDMTIKQIFSMLDLDTGMIRDFRLIGNLDSNGVLVADHDK